LIWIEEDVERIVPLEATDRSPEAIAIFPFPIDLSSVRQLLATYERIQAQPVEGTEDEYNDWIASGGSKDNTVESHNAHAPDTAGAHLGIAGSAATASGVSEHRAGVSPIGEEPQRRRGGER
jgi:hypothetical protein